MSTHQHDEITLILGQHPHRPQGIEIVDGRPIFYSKGNFAFDWAKMRGRNQDGILIECRIVDQIRELSAPFGTRLVTSGQQAVLHTEDGWP